MSVDAHYLYIIIEDNPEGMKLVRSLQPEADKQKYWGGNTKRVRAYTTEAHAKLALKQFGRGELLRVDLNDGEILR